jgi:hypothetical protein
MIKTNGKHGIKQIIEGISAEYENDVEVRKKLDKVIDLLTSIKS